jgi:hypothetical protein
MSQKMIEDNGLFVSIALETKIVRIVGNSMIPSNLRIKSEIIPDEDLTEDDLREAISKITFWFENIVSQCVAFSAENPAAIDILIDEEGKNRTNNMLMMTPGEPTDEILAPLFCAKMRALAGSVMTFDMVQVKSDNSLGLRFAFTGDPDVILPSIEEWIGDRSFFADPWWHRGDGSTVDLVPEDDADLTQEPPWALPLHLNPVYKTETPKAQSEPATIIRPTFRPTVIDGGKANGVGKSTEETI